jgi:hypothetical protein
MTKDNNDNDNDNDDNNNNDNNDDNRMIVYCYYLATSDILDTLDINET